MYFSKDSRPNAKPTKKVNKVPDEEEDGHDPSLERTGRSAL